MTLTLTLSTPCMPTHLGNIVVKFEQNPTYGVGEIAILVNCGRTDDAGQTLRHGISSSRSTIGDELKMERDRFLVPFHFFFEVLYVVIARNVQRSSLLLS